MLLGPATSTSLVSEFHSMLLGLHLRSIARPLIVSGGFELCCSGVRLYQHLRPRRCLSLLSLGPWVCLYRFKIICNLNIFGKNA